jgi:uncharacterized membrane protein YcaP (DUF421 family)
METVLRVALIYVFVMVGLRMLGKREFGELAPFDLVVLLLIPEIVSQSLIREDYSFTNSMVGVATLLMLVFFTSVLSHRFRKVGSAITGVPAVLVRHGLLVTENLNRERVRPDEILDATHQVGLHRMDQVQWAILEGDGRISVIPWTPGESRPAPRKHTQT